MLVVDVAGFRVQQVEHLDGQPHVFSNSVTRFEIDEPCRLRSDRVVFDQRARSEVAKAQAAEDTADAFDGCSQGDDVFHRAWNVVAGGIGVDETAARQGNVAVDYQPRH